MLYNWDTAVISPASEDHTYYIQVESRPKINNRRKYPRMDISNICTLFIKGTDLSFTGKMYNISANGFAFICSNNFFADCKGTDLTIRIENFALPQCSILEGRIIRCSDNNGYYIVGCQMPEDNYAIKEYVEKNI